MDLRYLLGQVINHTLEGRCREALLFWTTNADCKSPECEIASSSGMCSSICILPHLLDMSMVYDRDRAFHAYKQLKEYTQTAEYMALAVN